MFYREIFLLLLRPQSSHEQNNLHMHHDSWPHVRPIQHSSSKESKISQKSSNLIDKSFNKSPTIIKIRSHPITRYYHIATRTYIPRERINFRTTSCRCQKVMSIDPVHRKYASISIAGGKKRWCCKGNSHH